jgi:hypothetical protein
VLPVWLLLAPRDYLSTFLKLGTVLLLAIAVVLMRPEITCRGHAVHRRHRPDLRRRAVPVRVHHHRLRRDLRLPRARVERHDAEADR